MPVADWVLLHQELAAMNLEHFLPHGHILRDLFAEAKWIFLFLAGGGFLAGGDFQDLPGSM